MFTKLTQIAKLLPCLVLPILTVACDPAQPQEGDELNLGTEEVAAAVSALCTDNGATNVSEPLILGEVGDTVTGTSPSQTYGTAACSGRFVVEARETYGKPNISASVIYADAISSSSCASGTVSMLVYGFSPVSNSWVQLSAEAIAHGTMVPSPFGGAPSCQVAVGLSVPSNFTKLRVAAKAYLSTPFGPAPKKVTATIFSHH